MTAFIDRIDDGRLWFVAFVVALMAFGTYVMYAAHKDDARLEAECKARGGRFVEARSPLHVCVAEAK